MKSEVWRLIFFLHDFSAYDVTVVKLRLQEIQALNITPSTYSRAKVGDLLGFPIFCKSKIQVGKSLGGGPNFYDRGTRDWNIASLLPLFFSLRTHPPSVLGRKSSQLLFPISELTFSIRVVSSPYAPVQASLTG